MRAQVDRTDGRYLSTMSETANALRQLDKIAGLGELSGSEIVAAAGLLKHELLRGAVKKLAGESGLEIYDDLTQKAGEGLSAFEAHLSKRIEETGRENGYSDQEIADTKYVAGAAMKLAQVVVAGKGAAGSKGTVGKAGVSSKAATHADAELLIAGVGSGGAGGVAKGLGKGSPSPAAKGPTGVKEPAVAGAATSQNAARDPVYKGDGVGGGVAKGLEKVGGKVPGTTLTRAELIAGLPKGTKISPDKVVDIRKLSDGRTVWLETGNDAAGLQHILNGKTIDFARRGISQEQIPKLIFEALGNGRIVATTGSGRNLRNVYEVNFRNTKQNIAIGIADNGFIVNDHPFTVKR